MVRASATHPTRATDGTGAGRQGPQPVGRCAPPAVPQQGRRGQHGRCSALIALLAVFAPFTLALRLHAIRTTTLISCAPHWWPGTCRAAAPAARTGSAPTAVGRDLFVRMLYGARVSLAVGLVATLVSLVIGVLYGATAGFVGGRIDAIMMRIVDILYSLPFIFFVIILMVIFDRNFILLFVAIGAVEWLTMARIVRGQTLSVKQKEFVEAARAGGRRTVRHHPPPHRAQCGRAGDRLCHADDSRRDPGRELPLLPGPRHPRAVHVLGRADLRRRGPDGNRALDADLSRRCSWR